MMKYEQHIHLITEREKEIKPKTNEPESINVRSMAAKIMKPMMRSHAKERKKKKKKRKSDRVYKKISHI